MHLRYRILSCLMLAMFSLSTYSRLYAQEGCVGGEVCLQEVVVKESSTEDQFNEVDGKVSEALPQLPAPGLVQDDGVTTLIDTQEQQDLVDGISRNLKYRNLTRPPGNNAFDKILRLRDIHPKHDYAVNGEKYIARIFILLGRKAVQEGKLDLASTYMLKGLKFDPKVKRQDELKRSIAKAARERQTKATIEQAPLTAYLPSETPKALKVNPADNRKLAAPVMVAIPAGNFLMGSDSAEDEKPIHHVRVEAFSMAKHEVTLEQYRAFALATGRLAPQYTAENSNSPAAYVSWSDALAYAEWLSDKTNKPFRLPTESEWEYAARAGTTTPFFTGEKLKAANCVGCDSKWGGKSAAPVGSFIPNEFGLYDMHGNVWEWVQDCWTDNYSGRTKSADAVGPETCERRVLRGGSWYNDADYARSSYRGNEVATFRDTGVGFRVVHDGL